MNIIAESEEKAMNREALVNAVEQSRRYYDMKFDPQEQPYEEEFELQDKPESNFEFEIAYHCKVASLYTEIKFESEKRALSLAEDMYKDTLDDLKEMENTIKGRLDTTYWQSLGTAWACKDFIEGEV